MGKYLYNQLIKYIEIKIRNDFARPNVHARNQSNTSIGL
jgi:hypothetical protein